MDISEIAKKAEKISDWREAERLWLLAGCKLDAEACKTIYEATERGDYYRARVLDEAGLEPNKCDNPRAWVKWFDHMRLIYKEIYVTSE